MTLVAVSFLALSCSSPAPASSVTPAPTAAITPAFVQTPANTNPAAPVRPSLQLSVPSEKPTPSAVATVTVPSASPRALAADPTRSTVDVAAQPDGTLTATVHLRDASGAATSTLRFPWLVVKAIRPPYSGALGAYTTGPSQVDDVVLVSGGRLGTDHGTGVIWVAPAASEVTARITPRAADKPAVVGWIVDDSGQGVPIGEPTAQPTPVR